MHHLLRKPFLITVAGAALLALTIISSRADDLLSRAGAYMREKDYDNAYASARTMAESPTRSFLLGVAALRLGKSGEALPFLEDAERKLPLAADYAALYQAEALLKQKKYAEAANKAAAVPKLYPASQLIRRSEKLYADILFEAGDYKGALKAFQLFVEKYASGNDSQEALFRSAHCREETGDKSSAIKVYRSIWLNNPASIQAKKSRERLKELEKTDSRANVFSPEDLLQRASTLYARNEYSAAFHALQDITPDGQPAGFTTRMDFRMGMTHYRLKNWLQAEKILTRLSACTVPGIRSEARFWLAKTLERQDQTERAFGMYMELADEGKKQEFADDALIEAAGLRRSQGKYGEAARMFEKIINLYPDSKFVARAAWEAAWSHYLAGEHAVAAESFKALLKDEGVREKALYWLARTLENTGNADAASYYRILLAEYPAGFYATWYREQAGVRDARELTPARNALTELPLASGFEKPRLLASLGMREEARLEMAAALKKANDRKKIFPALARIYLEMGEYGAAIALFQQNRPIKWEPETLPLWSAGYPLAYTEAVGQHAAANTLPESLVYALIRSESGFSPAIKSPAGAVGLMQLMPATAKMTAREKGFSPTMLTTPEYNIKLGTKHFRELLKGFDGDVVCSIAAYNAGSAAVGRWRNNLKGLRKDEFIECIPYQETRDYVKKVYASAATYRQLYGLK
jgi:soluble lytic murein transglycosylase